MANIEFKTLEQFMPYWCQKILPAVYDDSLSYYQLLGRILQKYNEVIEIVNKHSETLVDHENRITAAEAQIELNRQAIEALKEELAKLDEQVKQNTANIAALTERVNGHDEAIETLQEFVDNFKKYGANRVAYLDSTTHELRLGIVPPGGSGQFFIPFANWGQTFRDWGMTCFTLALDTAYISGLIFFNFIVNTSCATFGVLIENDDLHYFKANYTKVGSTADRGATTNWKEVELLDITNIKQSLGDGEYDTISQKVLTQLINSKLNHDMGITGATAGQYINIATVDADGKPLTYGFGTPGGGGSGVDIVQTTGQSTTSVMSQKAVTDQLNSINSSIVDVTSTLSTRVTVVYPTTSGGTDGKFVLADGTTATRMLLLSSVFGKDGSNEVFTVKKTGATSWDRITWFKSSAGEGIYDFAWYETDGTNAKAGVDRLTVATTGLFAVTERSSTSFGKESPGSIIAGEFQLNAGDLILKEGATPSVTTGLNGGYFPDGFFDGATTDSDRMARVMQLAFPVLVGHYEGTSKVIKIRCTATAYEQNFGNLSMLAIYPYSGSGVAHMAIINCYVTLSYETPYFTIKYKDIT